jgi:predicted methyltransferase
LFHYTGSPNRLTSGRDVPGEVLKRLERAGFRCHRKLDGVLGVKASAVVKSGKRGQRHLPFRQ